MLKVEHLNKEIMNFSLKDISFHLPKGYIMGLVGVNASGKSSLIKTILNIYHKDSGNILVDGLSMDDNEKAIKNLMGIVLDENYYEPNLSGDENAKYFGQFFEKYDHDVFIKHCREFNVDTKKKLRKLSKGQQMKFQIAFALSHEAKLFIMDEPTANLDQAFRLEFMEIMQNLILDGDKSILLSTHQTDTLDQIADYITLIHNGKIVFSMSKEVLIDDFILLSGNESSINNLPEDIVVYKENGIYHSMALIYSPKQKRRIDEEAFTKLAPTIEELMYFMIKGEFYNVETNMERQPSF